VANSSLTLACAHSFGYYFAILPALLNVISFIGFCAVNSIVAGQVLAAVNPGHLSVNAGIVIVAVISMLVSFCGYKVLHTMERWAWMPVLLAFILLAGFGARHLGSAPSFAASEPATAGAVFSFISIIVGFTISWSGCSADFNTYMRPDISSVRVCLYTFAGLYLPCMLVQVMGAAFAAAALSGAVPTWEAAFGDGSVGGLVGVAVEPMRGFGKFLLVLFSLGMICESPLLLHRAFRHFICLHPAPLTRTCSQQRPDPIRLLALAPDRLPLLDETASVPPPDRGHGHLPSDRHRRRCALCECAEQLSRFARVLELDLCRHLARRGKSTEPVLGRSMASKRIMTWVSYGITAGYSRNITPSHSTCSSEKVASRRTTSRSGTALRASRPASPPSSPRSAVPHWSSSGWTKSGSAARSRNSSRGRTRTPEATLRSRRAWRSRRPCISRRGGSKGARLDADGSMTEALIECVVCIETWIIARKQGKENGIIRKRGQRVDTSIKTAKPSIGPDPVCVYAPVATLDLLKLPIRSAAVPSSVHAPLFSVASEWVSRSIQINWLYRVKIRAPVSHDKVYAPSCECLNFRQRHCRFRQEKSRTESRRSLFSTSRYPPPRGQPLEWPLH
jgi:hypothetical protein